MNCWGMTDKGIARKENQDTYGIDVKNKGGLVLCCVCDGMGGANAGDIASKLASEAFMDQMEIMASKTHEIDDAPGALQRSADFANNIVYEKSKESESYYGMGTTLVGAAISDDTAYVINIGDSRAYCITENGIQLITRDHSLVEDMVIRGDITREEAAVHPNRNLITRALGTGPEVIGDIFKLELNQGEYLLLCSDGLTNVISEQEILFEVLYGGKPETCCERLIDMVLTRGAPDNVTVVLAANSGAED